MKDRMLVICCTRGRSELALDMYHSLVMTSTNADLIFCIDRDDPKRPEYQKQLIAAHILVIDGLSTTKMINMVFKIYPDYHYYSITNDDVVYETEGWDKALMNKGKISYGNDMCQGENMPTISVIDGDICRALDWLQMPTLTHLYGDCVWKVIGQSLKILDYHKDIITNHKHFMYNKKVEKDATYEKTNSSEMYRSDARAFEEWVREEMQNDLTKVRSVL